MNLNLAALSQGERLWVWRLRHALTQRAAAALLGCGRVHYWRLETDLRQAWDIPTRFLPLPTSLTPPEQFRLARRRLGWPSRRLGRHLGVSHITALAWETHADARLRKAYETRGFRGFTEAHG